MHALGFTRFDTPIGACALAWNARGIAGAWLPERDAAALRLRVARRLPLAAEQAPPAAVQAAVERIVALLQGADDDLQDVALDYAAIPDFNRRVYDAARAIHPGQTLTYLQIALQLGEPGAARAVGQALGRNPFPILVPCHRVLAAGGKAGGFSAPGGVVTKYRLLEIEGAFRQGEPQLF
ncbi:MAG: methylated-DNA--[protein]-cysteine S-methyltransferase [Pseudomonadota bacterium]